MTAEQRRLCDDLIVYPLKGSRISEEEFLRQFPSAVQNGVVAVSLLEDAAGREDADDVSPALVVGFVFGFAPEHREVLSRLIYLDWHLSHEDVVSALDGLRSVEALEALFHATQWIPAYLVYDDARAMAVKAIWAIGKLPGADAKTRLEELLNDRNPILRMNAAHQLELRNEADEGVSGPRSVK